MPTKIEWTDETWNPTTGCTKISPGCKNCYAKRDWARLSKNKATVYFGRAFEDIQTHPERLAEPLKWKKPRRIFVNSMSDLFHEAIPFKFVAAVFSVMMATKQHTYQVLTKRPERAVEFFKCLMVSARAGGLTECEMLEECALEHVEACHLQADTSEWPLSNVWIGASVENQEQADSRIPHLLQIPARVRFLSVEPLLGEIELPRNAMGRCYGCQTCMFEGWHQIAKPQIDWVIVGGESGPNARPMHPEWARSLRDACASAGVPYFFKQWGEFVEVDADRPTQEVDWDDMPLYPVTDKSVLIARDGEVITRNDQPREEVGYRWMERAGKKCAGRLLDGVEHNAFPEVADAH